VTGEDERAIVALLIRYATGIDRRDWPLFRSCFAEDFVGDYPGYGLWLGPDAITGFMEDAHEPLGATLHRMTNFAIMGEGDGATATSYVDVLLMPATDDGTPYRGAGYYDDELVRTGGAWKIVHRRYTQVQLV
jgi:3-phenylpropionate/cinnamic acid dioxygenase small subunit